ncbi:MAG TPA: LysM peptidoglycan-binding domain-containing protein [Hyphomicrobiales bacterium]|nr:LysM peptidoglycan-binding domain-containing protein [Hyphomicrobiales bacterium]
MLAPLALTACTTVNNPPPVVMEPPVPELQLPVATHSEPVIENLVNQATQRRYAPIDLLPAPAANEEEVALVTTVVPMTANRIVERTINDYLQNRRSVLQMWIGRGQTYFPMIEQIFAEEGVPDELKYLALGESGLNPTAGSPAGAMGMWQFMAQTARAEGLRVDNWVDERRDPEKSTRAAAHHLKALHNDYNGRWHLALAGYNCSFRCISRSVERAGGTIEDPPSYWDVYPFLPQETRAFVPNYIAASLVVSHPEFYGIEVEDLGQEFAYDQVLVQGMLSLEDAARFAGTDLPSIKNLNPALLRGTLPNDPEPFPLKLPLGTYDRFVSAFETVQPQGANEAGTYVVKKGDTLGKIAQQYKVGVAEIQTANGIKGSLINIGQKLDIPGQGRSTAITLVSTERNAVVYGKSEPRPIRLGDEFQLVQQSGSTPGKPLMAVRLSELDEDEGVLSLVPTIYKVSRGDTLGAIAKRFGVSVASIQETNRLKGNMIIAGQSLTIHSATTRALESATLPATTAQQSTRSYEVQNGDNLYDIARKFGVSIDSIKQLNRLPNDLIRVGQHLLLD